MSFDLERRAKRRGDLVRLLVRVPEGLDDLRDARELAADVLLITVGVLEELPRVDGERQTTRLAEVPHLPEHLRMEREVEEELPPRHLWIVAHRRDHECDVRPLTTVLALPLRRADDEVGGDVREWLPVGVKLGAVEIDIYSLVRIL